jgi:transcriptional regulator of acetoin/glycerol metabolism
MQDVMHDYWAIWKQFVLQGVMQEDALPPSLVQSWRRCAAMGLDPYGPAPFNQQEGSHSKNKDAPVPPNPAYSPTMLSLVRPAMEDLHQFAEGAECVVIFADAQACIVDIVGAQSMLHELEHIGLVSGVSWREEQRGANALALALRESFPIQLDGAMHYCAFLHPVYTSAAPVHDMYGQTIGVMAVIGRYEQCHPHTLGMITAAAQAVSNQVQMQVWLSNANDLLSELKTILQTLSEGILLLRYDGVISQMNTPAGTMLGLSPAKVTGRRLRDVIPLPTVLVQAMEARQLLSYEEIVFDTVHGRVTCLCTLKPITSHRLETGLEDIMSSTGLVISEPVAADGFVLILRSIERVQKLVHRITGARARLTFANVVGESPALKEALRLARLASNSSSTVLLHGETGTAECSPCSSSGGSERSFHASNLPHERSKSGSGFGSLRLLGRRALARGTPMLWGMVCPAFARSWTSSHAARRRASAPSQGTTYWAREGSGCVGSR